MTTREPFNVVIAGGGVAALEAMLALRELAGDRLSIQLVATAQQADNAARSIAVVAGAPVTAQPLQPRIHGMLLTGGKPKYLTALLSGECAFDSQITDAPVAGPAAKIAAAHLGPYLERCDQAAPVG